MLFLKIWDAREIDLELVEEGFISPLVNLRWIDQEGEHVAKCSLEDMGCKPRRTYRRATLSHSSTMNFFQRLRGW